MIKERVGCFTAGCNCCEFAVKLPTKFLSDDRYLCDYFVEKHKKISAKDCGHFRCRKMDVDISALCRSCTAGEPIRII